MYVVNTTRGDHVCRSGLACTPDEELQELARKVGVEPIEVIHGLQRSHYFDDNGNEVHGLGILRND